MKNIIIKDTTKTRENIGFLEKREDWAKQPAIFTAHTLKINGHPVMEDWEDGYMKKLAEIATSQGGRILELGYGLGLSSKAIQARTIENHFVIECHPDVIMKCIQDCREAIEKNRLHILSGFWQDVTPMLKDESSTGILFDTYPLTKEEIHKNHFWFFKEAYRLLEPGGVLTYYSDEAENISPEHMEKLKEAGFKGENISFEIVEVDPPADCDYWTAKTIVAPIVRK